MIWMNQTTFKSSKKPAWYRVKGEEIFHKKELQKQIKKSLELKKKKREKTINCMLHEKVTIVLSTVGLIKKTV